MSGNSGRHKMVMGVASHEPLLRWLRYILLLSSKRQGQSLAAMLVIKQLSSGKGLNLSMIDT